LTIDARAPAKMVVGRTLREEQGLTTGHLKKDSHRGSLRKWGKKI